MNEKAPAKEMAIPRDNRKESAITRQMSAALDLPATPTVQRYAIMAQQRTGSSFLSSILTSTGQAGVPTEYLNPLNIAAYRKRFPENKSLKLYRYLDHIEAIRTTANGVFGIKCLYLHVQKHFPSDQEISRFLHRFDRIIFLYRRDKLAQSISSMKAQQSDVWAVPISNDDPSVKYDYRLDLPLVARSLHALTVQERHIRHLLRDWNKPCLEISYEDLTGDFATAWPNICSFLSIQGVSASQVEIRLKRQRDMKSEELTEQFLQGIRNSDLYFKKD